MPTSGIARHAHNMHQFIYPKPKKLVQLTKNCVHCSAPISKHLKFCNQSCAAIFNQKFRPAGSESRLKGNESRKVKNKIAASMQWIHKPKTDKKTIDKKTIDKNVQADYTKVSICTNCNKYFPSKGNNITCSKECAKISSTRNHTGKKYSNRVDKRPLLMTGSIQPTYLYIKQHSITGLKYFGKTCQDPYKYKGSGRHWMRHFRKHGPEYIKTIWVSEPFTDAEDISEFAIFFSEEFDIIASKDWANMTIENGLDGAEFGRIVSEETRRKMSKSLKGKPLSYETKRKISGSHKGKTHSDESKLKMSIFWSGRPKSNETKNKLSESLKGKTHSIETRKKMSHSRKGKTPSDFTRLKISESLRKYHEDKKKVVKVKD